MNCRERFHAYLNFQPVDRMPVLEWATWWDKTVDRWKAEGLRWETPPDLEPGQALQRHFGLDLHLQTWIGLTTEATPKPAHHGAPIVHSPEEYQRILPTLYPKHPFDPSRLEAYAQYQARGEAVVWITLDGFFWGARSLMGIEPHLYGFYDEPDWMKRINEDLLAYNQRVFRQVCEIVTPDFMTFGEDMSYNNGPMLSQGMFDEFMLPYYREIVPEIRRRGTRVFVDSDGDITQALPWFIRAGVEGILPLERQAGVDVDALRRAYPKFLFMGHYDKMVMPRGEEAMRAEFERLLPVMRRGGFIASVDHQTPPGVSLENYEIYVRLLKKYAKKAAR